MKILILARNPKLYSHRRLIEAAIKHGHEARIIDTLSIYVNVTPKKPEIRCKGELIEGYEAVIPRIGASATFYGMAVVRQFEMQGVYVLNKADSINHSRDKLCALQLLARAGIDLPTTGFAHSTKYSNDLVQMVGGAPVIIKLLEGTQGLGVVLGETRQSARSIIEAFRQINANIMVQEYIKEAAGEDLRCFVVGGRIVAAMKRAMSGGDFRSNLHRGGKGTAVVLSAEEEEMALKATKVLGLNVAGVDLLRSDRGPLILEVNSSPGLEGIEQATGIDIADSIIHFVEKTLEKVTDYAPAETV